MFGLIVTRKRELMSFFLANNRQSAVKTPSGHVETNCMQWSCSEGLVDVKVLLDERDRHLQTLVNIRQAHIELSVTMC